MLSAEVEMSKAESLGKRVGRLRGAKRLEVIGDVVSRWRRSGQSQSAFSREAGIAPVTLGRWVQAVSASDVREDEEPVLVEVGVRDTGMARDVYEVVLADGVRVRVPGGFREAELAQILRVLSSTC